MKKLLTIFCTALVTCGLLVGCSKKEAEPIVQEEEPKTEVESGPVEEETISADEEANTQVANPWVGCDTLNDLKELAGFGIAENDETTYTISYKGIKGELGEITYTVDAENESQYIARKGLIKEGEEASDISGVNDNLSKEEVINVDAIAVTVKGDESANYVATWSDSQFNYSVYASMGFAAQDLATIVSLIK